MSWAVGVMWVAALSGCQDGHRPAGASNDVDGGEQGQSGIERVARGGRADAGAADEVFALAGDGCVEPGQRACAGPNSRQALVCDGDAWRADPPCAHDERCDPRSGADQGLCVPVAAECRSHELGVPFCAGDVIRTCAMLFTFSDDACGEHETCSTAGGEAGCTCADGYALVAGGCKRSVADDPGVAPPPTGMSPPAGTSSPAMPEVLASDQQGPQGVVVDGTHAYWANHNGSTIMKVSLSGGAPVPVVSDLITPLLVAVDATHVYWTNYENGSVFKASLNGGEPQLIASGQFLPSGLLVDKVNLYWVTADKSGMPGTVMRAPLSGGPPVTLALSATGVTGFTLDGGTLYWASGWTLWSMPKGGGDVLLGTGTSSTVVAMADGPGEAGPFVIRGPQVYWIADDNRQLVTVALRGGTVMPMASAPPGNLIQGVVVDDAYAYFAINNGEIRKVALTGGEATLLVAGVNNPVMSAIDADHIYWVEVVAGGARIMRLRK